MAKELLKDITIRNAKPDTKDRLLNNRNGLYLLITIHTLINIYCITATFDFKRHYATSFGLHLKPRGKKIPRKRGIFNNFTVTAERLVRRERMVCSSFSSHYFSSSW